jgi:hypothetical protein
MSRINPECADSETPDCRVAADVLLRQEPDEDEEEDEDNGKDKDDDEDDDGHGDDGYSE